MQQNIIIEFNCCADEYPSDVINLISTCILNVKCKHGVSIVHLDVNHLWCWRCIGFNPTSNWKIVRENPYLGWKIDFQHPPDGTAILLVQGKRQQKIDDYYIRIAILFDDMTLDSTYNAKKPNANPRGLMEFYIAKYIASQTSDKNIMINKELIAPGIIITLRRETDAHYWFYLENQHAFEKFVNRVLRNNYFI